VASVGGCFSPWSTPGVSVYFPMLLANAFDRLVGLITLIHPVWFDTLQHPLRPPPSNPTRKVGFSFPPSSVPNRFSAMSSVYPKPQFPPVTHRLSRAFAKAPFFSFGSFHAFYPHSPPPLPVIAWRPPPRPKPFATPLTPDRLPAPVGLLVLCFTFLSPIFGFSLFLICCDFSQFRGRFRLLCLPFSLFLPSFFALFVYLSISQVAPPTGKTFFPRNLTPSPLFFWNLLFRRCGYKLMGPR